MSYFLLNHSNNKKNICFPSFSYFTNYIFSYFQDGLKTIEHFSGYIKELATKLQKIRQKQDEERKKLVDLRNTLRNSPSLDSREVTMLFKIENKMLISPIQS